MRYAVCYSSTVLYFSIMRRAIRKAYVILILRVAYRTVISKAYVDNLQVLKQVAIHDNIVTAVKKYVV